MVDFWRWIFHRLATTSRLFCQEKTPNETKEANTSHSSDSAELFNAIRVGNVEQVLHVDQVLYVEQVLHVEQVLQLIKNGFDCQDLCFDYNPYSKWSPPNHESFTFEPATVIWFDGFTSRKGTALHIASHKGHLEVVKCLLENGAHVDTKDAKEDTSLAVACANGHMDVILCLLSYGANLLDGITKFWSPWSKRLPLDQFGAAHAHLRANVVTGWLHVLEGKQDRETVTSEFYPPRVLFRWAIAKRYLDVVQRVVEHLKGNKDLLLQGKPNEQPFILACRYGATDIFKYLLTIYPQTGMSAIVKGGSNEITCLHEASSRGQVELMKYLCTDLGADTNARDCFGRTPLHQVYTADAATLLLSRGADVHALDDNNKTPLHYSRDGPIAALLIKHGADVRKRDCFGSTPLHDSADCIVHSFALLKYLLSKGADASSKDDKGCTVLHRAAARSHERDVSLILSQTGVDVNEMDSDRATALHYAADSYNDQYAVNSVRVLVAHETDVNCKKRSTGESALHLAIRKGHGSQVECLLSSKALVDNQDNRGMTALHAASEQGHSDIVKLLLVQTGVPVNAQDHTGATPLHLAVMGRHIETVRCLLSAQNIGLDVNATGPRQETALHVAVSPKGPDSVQVLQMLLEHGANVNAQDRCLSTALHKAMRDGLAGHVRLLCDYDADWSLLDESGRTALHVAVDCNRIECFRSLSPTVDLNIRDREGRSVLHYAVKCGKTLIAQALLQRGAQPRLLDDQGQTALHAAVSGMHIDVLLAMFEHKPRFDINMRDQHQRTILHWALDLDPMSVSASPERYIEMVNLIVSQDELNFHAVDERGRSHLHAAVTCKFLMKGNPPGMGTVVAGILKHGMDVNLAESESRNTALILACIHGCSMEVIQSLVQQGGADMRLCNREGWTALDLLADDKDFPNGQRSKADARWFLIKSMFRL